MAESKAWRSLERVVAEHAKPLAIHEDGVVQSNCGHCGARLNRATHEDAIKPSPGDVAICWNCASVNQFDGALVLKAVREEDIAALDLDHAQLAEGRALIRAALTRNPRKRSPEA